MYKIDNRKKKNRWGYTFLGMIIGVLLVVGGIYVYDNYKKPILEDVNMVKQIAVSSIPQNKEKPPTVKADSPIIIPITQITPEDITRQLHQLINQERKNNGLQALAWDDRLAQTALAHSNDMMKNNYFGHNDLQGNDPSTRFNCYNPRENIAWTEGYPLNQVSSKMIADWMGSSTHRDNILNTISNSEGIGVSISGSYVIVTNDFC